MEKEEIYQELRRVQLDWLDEHCLSEDDVMEDESGSFVYVDDDDGLRKIYLPSLIDVTF